VPIVFISSVSLVSITKAGLYFLIKVWYNWTFRRESHPGCREQSRTAEKSRYSSRSIPAEITGPPRPSPPMCRA